ncbi:uncharacterized protein BX663DRAFT_525862 [Cokeromyces recurvatus]|uniref:uncharacterized protein n=1 Tax=Cokeromyces recurvatus TaxID=90255 RepID=UPI00221EBAE6|nr:uncharacterized protein BX663DRAFT_525862 [Cokeromyces recurvatus]KAI7898150.1 hypothetical protein BX663DRAFT_525862 [Cokeromyces recurvatus]
MYINWKEQASSSILLSSSLKWYRVEELISYLHDLRSSILDGNSYTIKRTHNYPSILHCSRHKIPASETKRFPIKAFYFCEGLGDWDWQKMDLLILLYNLLIFPNEQEVTLATITHDSFIFHNHHLLDNTGSIELTILMIINQILQSIEANYRKDAITLNKFEADCKLIWVNDQDQLKDHNVMNCDNVICCCFKICILSSTSLLHRLNGIKSRFITKI